MGAVERICLVDGTNMFFRAFHALPPLTTRKGLPTGAVYGFTSMLVKLIREDPKLRIVVVVDARGKTFRAEIDPEYKANRSPTPPDLVEQIPWIKKMVPALGLPLVEISGVEADDVIGTLATQAQAAGILVDIVTSDKDMMQLVGPGVQLVDTMHNRISREPEVEKKFGVTPDRVVEVQGLMGDAVDNIPGVKGVGEKTARRLIEHFGSLEQLYANLEEIENLGLRGASGIRKKLEAGQADAWRSRDLATIRRDVAVQLEDCQGSVPDQQMLRAISEELEFGKILGDLLAPTATEAVPIDFSFTVVSSEDFLENCAATELAALTFSHQEHDFCCALATPDQVFVCEDLPLGLGEVWGGSRSGRFFVEGLGDLLHALGLAEKGWSDPEGMVQDLRIASYVLEPSRRAHTLAALVAERRGESLPEGEAGDWAAPLAAAARALLTIGPEMLEELEAAGLTDLYRDLEMPLVPLLASMEARGIGVSIAELRSAGEDFTASASVLEKAIYEIAGVEFNIGSTKQLREVLFEKMGLPTKGVKKGKTGFSVDADVLARLAEQSPIAEKIVAYRALAKLNSTYVAGLLGLVDPETSRVHTRFNQTVAATGRLSSSDPNLQNIPVRTEEGRRIRAAFRAPEGSVFLAADYSQIELRVLAHLTGDPVLVSAFREGEDIHRRTAAEVYDVDPVFVNGEMRRQAKVINFGILYGMGPHRLSRELGVSRSEAAGIIERYFERYAKVQSFVQKILVAGRERGYVETLLGRRRYLPDLVSKHPGLRQAAERMAWNSPIQGTAADIIKLAMLGVEKRLEKDGIPAKMLLQIHDELFFEVPINYAENLGKLVEEEMAGVVDLAIPLVVDLKKGPDWAGMS